MRWHRVQSGSLIAPWNLPVSDVRIANRTLKDRQDRAATACGLVFGGELQAAGSEEGVLYWDADVDLSIPTLKAFLKAAGRDGQLGMVERPRRLDQLVVEPPGPEWNGEPSRLFGVKVGVGSRPVIVPPLGMARKIPVFRGGELELFLTMRTAYTVRHWVHLLQANLAALLPEIVLLLGLRPHQLLWSWLRWPFRAGFGRLARIGKGCSIHPTARLEGCVLGNGVRVGAYSVLRGCLVGDGATIEDHVSARGSVIAPQAHLANWCMFNLSVIGSQSSVGHIGAQASVIGDRTFISTFSTLEDLNLEGNVRVPFEGKLCDVGSPFLGCAVGNDAMVAAHVNLAPGRAVPNGVRILPDPGMIVTKIPSDLEPGSYHATQGRLVRR